MYRPAIAASARNGILLNGSLDALFKNYHAIARMFEMYIADVLSLERGVPFRLWEHLDRAIKDARGMSYGDTGIALRPCEPGAHRSKPITISFNRVGRFFSRELVCIAAYGR